jgi:ATP synthase I chain
MNKMPGFGDLGGSRVIQTALLWQLGAGLSGMLAAVLRYGVKVALGVGFGVLIIMLTTILLGRRLHGAAETDPESGRRMLYAGAVMRFMLVLVALAVAYGLGLHLLAVAVGMLLAQSAMFFYAASGLCNKVRQGTA